MQRRRSCGSGWCFVPRWGRSWEGRGFPRDGGSSGWCLLCGRPECGKAALFRFCSDEIPILVKIAAHGVMAAELKQLRHVGAFQLAPSDSTLNKADRIIVGCVL